MNRLILGLLALLLLHVPLVFGQAGTLDPTFDADGVVLTRLDGRDDTGSHAALQPDGKVVVVGSVYHSDGASSETDMGMVRYLPDGSLDASFGFGGRVTTDFGGMDDFGGAVAIQPDGKIVVAGTARPGAGYQLIAVSRYLPDGSLDPTFGVGGKVTTDLEERATGHAVVIQPDGKIVVGGLIGGADADFLVLRYEANGDLDAGFGVDGGMRTGLASSFDVVLALALRPDGRILAGGVADESFALVQYQPDGTLDPSFFRGTTVLPGESLYAIQGLAVLPDGRFLAVGTSDIETPTSAAAVVRYQANGLPDVAFGMGGLVTAGEGQLEGGAAIALHPSGGFVVAATTVSPRDFAALRFADDGTPVGMFGMGGIATSDFAGNVDRVRSMLVSPDGGIVVVGDSQQGFTLKDFALARFTGTGQPDATFGQAGQVVTDFPGNGAQANGTAVQPDGRIVVAGTEGGDFFVVRYLADGTLDPAFGTNGRATVDFGGTDFASAVTLQPDGKIVVAGATNVIGPFIFAVARLNPDGTPDLSFRGTGQATTPVGEVSSASAVAVRPDGRIVAAGFSQIGSEFDFALVQYLEDGTLDATFGTGGLVWTDFGSGDLALQLILQPDDKIVVAGISNTLSANVVLARYHTNGNLDTGFDGDGRVVTTGLDPEFPVGLALLADGGLLVGSRQQAGANEMIGLWRFTADGSPDLLFAPGGKVETTLDGKGVPRAMQVQPDGQVLFAGYYSDGAQDLMLARLTASGNPDASFGENGLVRLSGYGLDTGNALAFYPGDRIVVAGTASNGAAGPSTASDVFVARFQSDGSTGPDPVCLDPISAPSYAGGYVLNAAGTRAFIHVEVPAGAHEVRFYNTKNLIVADPETDTESGTPAAYLARVGDAFSFGAASPPTALYFPITTAGAGTGISFFLQITDACGRVVDVDPAFTVTGVEGSEAAVFALEQSQPNPAAGATTIRFSLEAPGEASLVVYDALGREVARLVQGHLEMGAHSATLDVGTLPSGVYVYRLSSEGRTLTRTLTVTR